MTTTQRIIPYNVISDVRSLYDASNRVYHGINHIDYLLAKKDDILNQYNYYVKDFDGYTKNQVDDYLTLSILFHDAEYNIWNAPGINELKSASLLKHGASDWLIGSGWTMEEIDLVCGMIIATAHHHKDNSTYTLLQKLMLDIDIANFSEDIEICKFNQEQIFQEFEPKTPTKSAFLSNNVKFLEMLLARPSIYYTPMFVEKEDTARSNIQTMIDLSRGG